MNVGSSTILYTHDNKEVAEKRDYLLLFNIKGSEKKINYKGDMYVCLDKHGNIILDENSNPVLVKYFSALQMTEFSNEYNGTWLSKRTTKIYPCRDCSLQTGIKNCQFVW